MLMISAKLADDRVVIPESSCKMKELLSCSTFSAWSVSTFRSKWQAWQRCPRWASICASGLTKAGICQAVCVVLRSMHAYLQDRQHVRLHSVAAFHAPPACLLRPARVAWVPQISVRPFAGEWDCNLRAQVRGLTRSGAPFDQVSEDNAAIP